MFVLCFLIGLKSGCILLGYKLVIEIVEGCGSKQDTPRAMVPSSPKLLDASGIMERLMDVHTSDT